MYLVSWVLGLHNLTKVSQQLYKESMINPISQIKTEALRFVVVVQSLSCVQLPSMGFSRQKHWSGVPLPSPIHTLLCINEITNENLLYNTGNSTQFSVMTYMRKESMYMYNSSV